MCWLVTGSSGWLGGPLVPLLLSEGHEVTGFDPVPGRWTDVAGSVADARLPITIGEHGIKAIVIGGALHKPDIARYPAQTFIDAGPRMITPVSQWRAATGRRSIRRTPTI